jgi:hypothetical protein
MEVHHLGHHESIKKSWKSYFFEFFMLFLAVISAFIAENTRDYFSEKEKEHQYMHNMVHDMEQDSLTLTKVIDANKLIVKGIDSLLINFKEPLADSTVKKIYNHIGYATRSILFENANTTISELKNAGGFRLIRDTAASNAIANYDQVNEYVKKQGDAYYHFTLDIINIVAEMMDLSVSKNTNPAAVSYFKNDPDKLRLIYNKCYMQQQIIRNYTNILTIQLNQSIKFAGLLKKIYQ